jgi:hypothetical protein
VTLTHDEQRALLRMERSLRTDPALSAALRTFERRCWGGEDSEDEEISPWHPVLWRVSLLALVAITLAFFAVIILVTSAVL